MPLFGEPGFGRMLTRAAGRNPQPRRLFQLGAEVMLGIQPGRLGETMAATMAVTLARRVGVLTAANLVVEAVQLAGELGRQADRLHLELDRAEDLARFRPAQLELATDPIQIDTNVIPMWRRDP